jgi:splicing factor 3B subunit 2
VFVSIQEEEKPSYLPDKGEVIYSDEEQESEGDEDQKPKQLSKKKQRKVNRLSVAELKRLVKKPEMVEWTDVTAQDPKLLITLKSHRNTIPVPAHWTQKRDYLQGKRGIEKPPFQLPSAFFLFSHSLFVTWPANTAL